MASQPPTPHDVEEVQEPDIEFDWENETIEQWAYARQDTMTRELFQAPRTGTPQHWNDLRYHQARRARQQVLDLQNTRQEVESQLLMHHLHVVQSQNLNGLPLERARDEVMRIYGHHLEMEVEPFRDYLRAVQPKDMDELDVPAESEVEFNYGPKTQWTEEEYIRL